MHTYRVSYGRHKRRRNIPRHTRFCCPASTMVNISGINLGGRSKKGPRISRPRALLRVWVSLQAIMTEYRKSTTLMSDQSLSKSAKSTQIILPVWASSNLLVGEGICDKSLSLESSIDRRFDHLFHP